MSDLLIQQQRKAEAIRDASELVVRSKPDAERLNPAMAELLIADEDKIAAILFELAEMVSRLDRSIDHISDHLAGAQEKEIEALKGRVEELQKGGADLKKEIGALQGRLEELEKTAGPASLEPRSDASEAPKDS